MKEAFSWTYHRYKSHKLPPFVHGACERIFLDNMVSVYENELGGWNDATRERVLNDVFANDSRTIVCTAPDGNVAGFITFFYGTLFGEKTIWITEVQVDSRYRGRGVGTTLIQIVLCNPLKDENLENIQLSVVETHTDTISLYERLGFELTDKYMLTDGPARLLTMVSPPGVCEQA